MSSSIPWPPARFFEPLETFPTSTGVARVRTDVGEVFVKALGNREGPHALAREYIGTRLAELLGLPVFEYALMQVGPDDDIPLGHNLRAEPGTALVTRAYHRALEWDGETEALDLLVNPEDLTRLVVADTWLKNPDRYPPAGSARRPNFDNVFIARQADLPGRVRLIAMDFSVCLYIEGRSTLTAEVAHLHHIQDDRVYGLYPAFAERLNSTVLAASLERLGAAERHVIEGVVSDLPRDWDVGREVQDAVARFLMQRAYYVAETLPEALRPYLEHQGQLPEHSG